MADDCEQVLTDLERYLDGETTVDLEAVMQRHLDACPPCLDRAAFERDLKALIATKCRDSAPPGLIDRVRARLHDLV